MISHLRLVNGRDFLFAAFATYGGLWLVVESTNLFFGSPKLGGWPAYIAFLIAAAIGALFFAWPKTRVEFPISASDSSFEIRFGDLFDAGSVIVIPVNDFFDGELGDHVSENSLHGKFITRVLGGQSERFVDLTSRALAEVRPVHEGVPRSSGRRDRYKIGTVARVDVNDRRYLLVALSHTDPSSLKASASVHDLWTCLAGAWKGVREFSNGQPVSVPLIGSGLSGVGLPPKLLVEILITSFLYHTKQTKVADAVTLVLPSRFAGQIDLKSIEGKWT